jgi:nicotinamidase-related amidase
MPPYVTQENLSEKSAEWLRNVEHVNVHTFEPELTAMALMVIDMQVFFCTPGASAFLDAVHAILPNIKKLIQHFRQWNRPVIYTRHVHREDGSDAGIMKWWWQDMCVEGSPESEIHPELTAQSSELVVAKHRYSAFYNTDLEILLRGKGITDLVITGVMTNMCCESTTRDAYYRDYRVQFLADATASATEDMHTATLLNVAYGFANITTTDRLLSTLKRQTNAHP